MPRKKKLYRAPYPIRELVRPGQIHGPLPHHRVVESFHEFGQVHNRKCSGHLAALLPLRQNFSQQTDGSLLVTAQFRGSHRIHGARQHHRLPKFFIAFDLARHGQVESAQALLRPCLVRQFQAQALADTGIARSPTSRRTASLLGKISEKSGLADFEHLHNVVDPGVIVSVPAKQLDRGADNLLPQACLLPLPQPASGCSPTFPAVVVRVTSALAISAPFPVHERRTLAAVPQKVIVTITK